MRRKAQPGGHLRLFVPLALLVPIAAGVVGVDGSPLFQILASESLGMGPSAIGLAFGLGVLSLPVQILAARIPLRRAQRNLRLFAALLALLCLGMAGLVMLGSFDGVAVAAIAIAVAAEISVSVLYATSWLPLQTALLTSHERQRLASQLQAVGGLAFSGLLVALAAVGAVMRVVVITAIAVALVVVAAQLQAMPNVTEAEAEPTGGDTDVHLSDVGGRPTLLLICSAVLGFASWPVFLVYVADVLWPSINTGIIGAMQLGSGTVTALLLRPATGQLGTRANGSAWVLLASTVALLITPAPVESAGMGAIVLAATVLGASAMTALRLTLLEMVHQSVDTHSSVKVFTMLDVFASTSLQLGLLAGGVLISASADDGGIIDPYRGYLAVTVTVTAILAAMLSRSGSAGNGPTALV